MKIYDLTLPISPNMILYPGDVPVRFRNTASLAKDGVEATDLGFSTHTGTHVDAPKHFVRGGGAVDAIALEKCIGPALVIELKPSKRLAIEPADLKITDWKHVPRIFFKTQNSQFYKRPRFTNEYRSLSIETAQLLIRKGVKLVGVDYLSIEPTDTKTFPVHKALLKAGIVIVESCNLSGVPAGEYTVSALPLRLKGLDGSPARVVLYR